MKLTRSRHLKYLLVVFISCLFVYRANGQLVINKDFKLRPTDASVEKFIAVNNFDYALIVWSTSNWSNANEQFSCFIKQNNNWYITKILSPNVSGPPELVPMVIKQTILKKTQADSLINILKPDSAFCYSQSEFTNLPDTCSHIKDGKRTGLYGIYDAATYHLVEISNKNVKRLLFYAPEDYLSRCYPYAPEFGILRGFVNSCNELWKATSKL
jgi:hypothetical protein